ncbi:S-phase kinase-associated protein 1a [Lasiodiplodia theobromae]|uniref:S-phase kinase-associated protein 1a n=1 Tax=Lasiodiplodia theobromae TaxID=45133 RepID=UPI0015C3B51C|nr:S-phase kinase-associated protein 1a [Lasiodiplodia theobromae]KAF4537441.1 S-phase kinase-associated protein 1a [Lasiodiplodia theobromae]
MKGNYVALKAANDVIVDADREVARKSGLISTLLDNSKGDEEEPIAVEKDGENLDAPILRMTLDWCEHHKNYDTSRRIDYVRTPFYALPPIDEWDQTFMSLDLDTLFEITVIRDMFGNHDMPIGDEQQPESQPWNASRVFNPLLQLAKSITGSQPARHSSSATFPPLTPADLPASYTYRTTWPDFTFVRALVYHFPLRSRRFFNAGIHLRVAALGCRPWVVARWSERRSYRVATNDDGDLTASSSSGSGSGGSGDSSSSRRSSVAGLYLSTEPLPSPSLDYGLWLPIPHRIVFQVRVVGQGWVREGGAKDVLDGQHAWFEASILTPVIGFAGLATDGATLQDVMAGDTWETPVQARGALMRQGWDFVEREDGGVVWKVCNSVTTSGRYQDCKVEWKRGVEMQVEDESAAGKGDGFLETLTSSYNVVLWARAEHKHRENRVGAAAIEIEYEFPPPGTTRHDGSPL